MKRVLLFCLLAAAAAEAQVRLGPITTIPQGAVSPAETSSAPRVATDGRDFLIGYNDYRGARATVVTAAGEVRDPLGIALPVPPDDIVWSGSVYFVIGTRRGTGITRYVRLTATGMLLDTTPRELCQGRTAQAASNGETILVACDANDAITLIRLSGDGATSATRPAELGNGSWRIIELTSNGDGFLVLLTRDWTKVRAVPLSRTGEPLATVDSPSLDVPCVFPAAASDGDGYLVVCESAGYVLDGNGTWRGAGLALRPSGLFNPQLAVVWTGDSYLVAIPSSRQELWLERASRSGERIAPPELHPTRIAPSDVALAFNGSELAIAHASTRDFGGRLDAFVLDWNLGRRAGPFPVSFSTPRQSAISAARGDGGWLVVWSEPDGSYATRLRDDGTLLNGERIRIADVPAYQTATVWTGETFVVVWQANFGCGLCARTVSSATGIVGERYVLAGSVNISGVSAASGDDGALVHWIADRRRRLSFFDRSGSPLPAAEAAARDTVFTPLATSNGREFLTAWTEATAAPPCQPACPAYGEFRIMTAALRQGQTAESRLFLRSPGDRAAVVHAVASLPASDLIVWREGTAFAYSVLDRDGAGGPSLPLPPSFRLSVAGDGTNFLVLRDENETSQIATIDPAGSLSPFVDLPVPFEQLVPGRAGRVLAIGTPASANGTEPGNPRGTVALVIDEEPSRRRAIRTR